MRWERINRPADLPVSFSDVETHLRIDGAPDLAAEADGIALAAAHEVEDYGQLALLTQTIRVTFTGPLTSGPIALPVGPVLDGASATVTLIAEDSTTTALDASDYRLATGARPVLHLLAGVGDEDHLRIEYPAGFGADASAVPADLQHAVLDHAAKIFDMRGGYEQHRHSPSMSPHAARIAARYRGVRV